MRVGGVRANRFLDLAGDLVGALQGRAVGEDHRGEEPALVLVGNEAAGDEAPQPDGDRDHPHVQHRTHDTAANHPCHAMGVTVGDVAEPAIEQGEETLRRRLFVAEDLGAERGRERQRDQAGDHDGDRDRHRELPVELAGQAAQERDRYEHGRQRQHDGDDRPGDFMHRLDRRFARLGAILAHDPLDVFEHDDRVVDDNADREHHAEQRQRVDRVPEQVKARERAEQRDRHRNERDQRRASSAGTGTRRG